MLYIAKLLFIVFIIGILLFMVVSVVSHIIDEDKQYKKRFDKRHKP